MLSGAVDAVCGILGVRWKDTFSIQPYPSSSGQFHYLFFGGHVTEGGRISQSLGLHDPLHVGRPAVLRRDDTAWGRHETVGNDDLEHG